MRTEVAFERTFGSHAIAQLILFGAFLSLLKIFNGNFVAATRMLYAIGRRNLVHPALGRVHAGYGTPVVAIALMALLTAAAAMFGDAILVPITEVGSLAVGVGWLSACAAYLARRRKAGGDGFRGESAGMAWARRAVSAAIILMKVVPGVPGSFTRAEWIAFVAWSALGLRVLARAPPAKANAVTHARRLKRLLDELVLRQAAENFNRLVDHRLRYAADMVTACQIGNSVASTAYAVM